MKRNIVIVVAGILLLIMLSLFYTYATSVTMDEISGSADLTYNVNLSDPTSTIITVEPGETKYFDIVVTNTNDGAINYGLVYNQVEINTVTVAQTDVSKYKAIDSIEKDETRRISLVIKNEKTSNITYSILPVTGYKQGGDLVVPSNHTLIDDVYSYKSGTITGSVHDYVPGGVTGGDSGGSGGSGGSNNLDTSGANSPDLLDGLIPVMYSNGTWIKADSTNTNETYKWYDYTNKQWANAVLVSSANRENYKTADAGETINDSDILAYYVWIPRYKYKVWNITKTIGTDSYNAETTGIDIVFEKEKATTGTIDCKTTPYSFAAPIETTTNETCTGTNGEYYTHPAFTFGDTELTGLWVGKFEISSSSPTTSYGGGETVDLSVRVKPNVISWRYNPVTNFSKVIQNMSLENNEYGLTTSAYSHMVKNMEWGSIAYLTHSIYGRCSDGTCEELTVNSNSSYYTGGNAYATNVGQSTTGNVYGVYDMSGGAFEYVMGNMSSAAGSYTYYASAGGSNFSYSTTTAKYIDTYAYGTSSNDQIAYNRARLGDATGEVTTTTSGKGWYEDYAYFVISSLPWFGRGGSSRDGSNAGVFYFNGNSGSRGSNASARACLVGGA